MMQSDAGCKEFTSPERLRKRFWRGFIAVLVLLSLITALGCSVSRQEGRISEEREEVISQCEDCNIILITVDSLRPDHLGLYGYSLNTSPFLDAFADEAYVFSNAISQKPITPSAVSSIFTGIYPYICEGTDSQCEKYQDLPEKLESRGYSTISIVGTDLLSRTSGFEEGFHSFYDIYSLPTHDDPASLNASVIISKAREELISIDDGKFFLWLHFKDPHARYTPPNEHIFFSETDGDITELNVNPGFFDGFGGIPRFNHLNNRTDMGYYLALYDGEIREVDRQIGNLFEFLRSQGDYENSMIIVVGTHGESLGEHNFYFVHSVIIDEPNIRVPLIVKYPHQIMNHESDALVALVDIYPTILHFAGYGIDREREGMGEILSSTVSRSRELFIENLVLGMGPTHRANWQGDRGYFQDEVMSETKERGIRFQHEKIILNDETGVMQYYNLEDDPDELNDLLSGKSTVLLSLKRFLFRRKLDSLLEEPHELKEIDSAELYSASETSIESPRLSDVSSSLYSGQLDDFEFVSHSSDEEKDVFTYTRNQDHVIIEKMKSMDADSAGRVVEGDILQIKQIFMTYPSPYPGSVSREVECSTEFQPLFMNESGSDVNQYMITYSNDRFVVGVCSWDLVAYRHLFGWLYCQDEKTLFRIKYYTDLAEKDETLERLYRSFECS